MGSLKLGPTSLKHLATLEPEFNQLVQDLVKVAHANGLNVQISSGRRTPEEQDKLYAQGRTAMGKIVTAAQRYQSLHNYGIAVDLFFLVDGKASWKPELFETLWTVAWHAGLDRRGLVWSGNWVGGFKEMAHFQLNKPDWRELAAAVGIDPVTLNPKPKVTA